MHSIIEHDSTLTVADMPTLLAPADLPELLTVDASQGQESFMVILDASCQNANVMGMVSSRLILSGSD